MFKDGTYCFKYRNKGSSFEDIETIYDYLNYTMKDR